MVSTVDRPGPGSVPSLSWSLIPVNWLLTVAQNESLRQVALQVMMRTEA